MRLNMSIFTLSAAISSIATLNFSPDILRSPNGERGTEHSKSIRRRTRKSGPHQSLREIARNLKARPYGFTAKGSYICHLDGKAHYVARRLNEIEREF